MNRRLVIGLAPLLAIAGFAVMPVAAQAVTQHWYQNMVKATEGEEIPVVAFGNEVNVSQTGNPFGEVNCKNVAGGVIDNPVGGGAGEGKTNSFAYYECKGEPCEKEIQAKFGVTGRVTVTTENTPGATKEPAFPGWTNVLEESTIGGVSSVRERIGEPFVTFKTPSPPGMIRETVACTVPSTGQVVEEFIYEGQVNPEIGVAKTGNLNGTSASVPSQTKVNGATTGVLHSSFAMFETKFSGNLKYLGYFHQEVITVKP